MSSLVNKTVFALTCIFCVLLQVSAYSYIRLAPEWKGHCKDENGEARKVGETWHYEKMCEMATCTRNDMKLYEEVVGCVVVSAQKGCKLIPRLSTTYPHCCPVFRCEY